MDYSTVMNRKNNENSDDVRVKNFGGLMDAELVDRFLATIPVNSVGQPKYKKKHVLEHAMKLWIDLPPEIRNKLVIDEMGADSLIDLVQHIVDQRIQEGRKAGRALVERRKRKPGRKGQSP